jgi:Family of unknown function (DUF6152)
MTKRYIIWRIVPLVWLLGMGLGTTVSTAWAHHSGVVYDQTKEVQLVGTVTEFHWINPHVRIDVQVGDGENSSQTWYVESGPVGMMARSGWARTTLKAGDKVTLIVHPLKSGDTGGALVRATLPDGEVKGSAAGVASLPVKPAD